MDPGRLRPRRPPETAERPAPIGSRVYTLRSLDELPASQFIGSGSTIALVSGKLSSRMIGIVDESGRVSDAFSDDDGKLSVADPPEAGTWCQCTVQGDRAAVAELLATPGSALADLYALACHRRLALLHPPPVMAETAAIVADPGIDDPALIDLTSLPFVTIDEVHSRDLDQALFIEQRNSGYTVWYAIADPAWCVRPGTALFTEALRRGATYYLPGLVIPMLPRELSEDTVSLNPRVDRRALVFETRLDPEGRVERTRIHRARVRSRIKTSYDAVQGLFDGHRSTGELAGLDRRIASSLELLAEVGSLRLALAEARHVVALRRTEIAVSLAGRQGLRYVAMADPRNDVERYNEQISLLCNIEGARFLLQGDTEGDGIEPIYRVHQPPSDGRLDELGNQIEALVRIHRLDERRWSWRRGRGSLARYLESLPIDGPEARLASSIHRQVMLVGGRSQFAVVPGAHYGVGAEIYGRFTAPMREVVGVFEHKETWEKLAGSGARDDEGLRRQVVEAANRARQTQRELDREVNRRVLDQLFGDDLRQPLADRPRRRGTVLGISRSKVHVGLDDPPIDVKVYIHHLKRQLGGRVAQGRDQMTLRDLSTGSRLQVVGDDVSVRALDRDPQRDRWQLELLPGTATVHA